MRVHATLSNIRLAPRKVRLVTHLIVGRPADAALVLLGKTVKRSAAPIATLLSSAIANAVNNFHLERATLFVSEVRVGDGARLKRYMPKAFGQATQILRRSSHVTIFLEGEAAPRRRSPAKKVAPTKTEAAASTPNITTPQPARTNT